MAAYSKLLGIQKKLKVPKDQNGVHYKYRNVEDIFQNVKPLCEEQGAALTVTDKVELIGDRYYVVSTATLIDIDTGDIIAVTEGWAREAAESKNRMDCAQITGAASTYARKRALCGMFAIDDEKDDDAEPNTPVASPVQKSGNVDALRKRLIDELNQRQIAADDLVRTVMGKSLMEIDEKTLTYTLNNLEKAIGIYNQKKAPEEEIPFE